MRSFKKLLLCGFLIIGSLFVFEAVAYGQAPGQLVADHVRVRRTPSLESDYNILFQVNYGEYVTVLDVAGFYFYRVNVRDYTNVYIYREFISIVENSVEYNSTEFFEPEVEITEINQEEYQQELVSEVAPEEVFAETLHEDVFYEIESLVWNDSWTYSGLIPADMVDMSDFMPENALADDVVAHAKTFLGTPYRWGSTDPSRGFDCSGFVFTVMRNFDVNLNRSSRDMAANNGTRVDRNAMQAGDLVFFATGGGGRVSHVGIYIGGDRFIHSATRGGVMISGMGETYWRTRFVRANRVL